MADADPVPELPELMLSLRSFGSRRGPPNESESLLEEQDLLFAPLLDARRTAAQAISRPQVVAAFDSRRLAALIEAAVRQLAAGRFATHAAARRALEAELFEIVEPVRDALTILASLAEAIPFGESAPAADERWRLWLAQLRLVFRVADASWPALRDVLASSPRTLGTSARWRFIPRGERPR
jgi:hypothetical protein